MVGIIHQIGKDLAHSLDVTVDRWHFRRRVERKCHRLIFLLRTARDIYDYIVGHVAQVDRLERKTDAPGFDT